MSNFIPPSMEDLQGLFHQYAIEKFIAQGGMGAVYLARQISLDRPVAIKILPEKFGQDDDYRQSFTTEAKAMAKLNHTNLVGIFDFGEINGMFYIVMEYVAGRTLFEVANGKKVDEKEAACLIMEISDGLGHAHTAGILHRDIKPANILLDAEAKPKVVDFGLAKPMSEGEAGGIVFGTPGYTAPEVLKNPNAVDQRSDVFSMGVMLYELLVGKLPGSPVVPASREGDIDPRFDVIIAKAIHQNPEMRYTSAEELSSALRLLHKDLVAPVTKQPVNQLKLGGATGSMSKLRLQQGFNRTGPPEKSNAALIVFVIIVIIGVFILFSLL